MVDSNMRLVDEILETGGDVQQMMAIGMRHRRRDNSRLIIRTVVYVVGVVILVSIFSVMVGWI